MTDGAGVTCRRCGFANVGGDQFCGSCGAFLEWEGDVADAAAPAATTDAAPGAGPATAPAADEGLSGLVRPAGTPAAPPPSGWSPSAPPVVPAVPAAVATPAGAATATGALLRCPACGIANAGTRTFCQSCGARLEDGSRVGEVSREQIAAAVSARPTPVSGAAVKAARSEPSDGGSRGVTPWLIGIAVLGIVVGVGFVVASQLLKGPGPATGASAAPGVAATTGPGVSAEPTTTDAPVTTEAPASAGPTTPVEPVALVPTGAAASSVVGGLAKFAADRAIDGSYKTCWQEGSPTEKGQWIEVSFAPSRMDAVVINNGYGASVALYKGNHRPKVVRISVDGGEPMQVTLKDSTKAQRIALGGIAGATKLRITIVSVYPAVKTSVSGTPFDDAALGEITVVGVPGG